MYFAGVVSVGLFWGITFYFMYTSYSNSMNVSFISLDPDAGHCEEVPLTVTGSFLASLADVSGGSKIGYWENVPSFQFNTTAFQLNVISYRATHAEYMAKIEEAGTYMAAIAAKQVGQSLSWNLLTLSTFVYSSKTVESGSFEFKSYVDINTVWDREKAISTFSSPQGICNYSSITEYDLVSAKYSIMMPGYGLEPYQCWDQVDVYDLLYDEQYDGSDFAFDVDMRSFSIAAAVNNGILKLSDLEMVSSTSGNFLFQYNGNDTDSYLKPDDDDYVRDPSSLSGFFATYYDPNYAGMYATIYYIIPSQFIPYIVIPYRIAAYFV